MLRFALVGNPNCGKTTMFNSLTGSTAHVGNWPGVTVDKREGEYKKCPEPVSIVDLPGIYSLSPYTPEEVVARNFIIDEKPECVINIVDATNLERNLYLTTQIMEMDVPVVVALNMIDVVEKNGDRIDVKMLEKALRVPVVKVSALKLTGLDELMKRAYEACMNSRKGETVLKDMPIMHIINDVAIALKGQNVDNPLFHAIKLVEADELEVACHPASNEMVEAFKETYNDLIFGNDLEAVVADGRYKYITSNYSPCMTRKVLERGERQTISTKIDKVLTHRIWGIPIFLVIMFLVFHMTFSEDFLFLGAMGAFKNVSFPAVERLSADSNIQALTKTINAGTFFGLQKGLNSPGVCLSNTVQVVTDCLTALAKDALSSSPAWVSGLITDGILGGVFSVLSFLPQILVLFLFFSILEDSGYMARIAFILDRIMRKFGLSGRAFLPMIMGFGCSVPAMINTRTLADKNEKIATIRVIPFFSCGAKLPILTAISGAIVQKFGVGNADLITYGMYLIGIITAFVTVLLMKKTSQRGSTPPFIMELPEYHLPQAKSLAKLLWDKAEHFIKKAFTVILASTIVVWFVSHFSWNWQFLDDTQIERSILAGIGQVIQPLFTPLGFGSQLGKWGWVFVVAAICGLIAKENVIATFSTMAACITAGFVAEEGAGGVDAVVQMITATGATIPALIAFILFNMTTVPCVATMATARAELGDRKLFIGTILFWICVSYILSMGVYLVGSWYWTSFLFAALIVVAIVLTVLYDKGKLPWMNKLIDKIRKRKKKA